HVALKPWRQSSNQPSTPSAQRMLKAGSGMPAMLYTETKSALVYAGSSTETTLPQALSGDGGRYMQGDVEFWIKGEGATLTRAG
ncbi:MliC family protein, partial [Microvirga sp. 3-52]|nr:MliC family protein [Microvirga sp. 3-52]